MDILDKRILEELTRNCRMTHNELSSKLGLSANAMRKRIDKLVENGTLYSYTIRPTLNTMYANIALSLIETDGKEDIEGFMDAFGNSEMVGEVNPIVTREGGFYLVISDYIGAEGVFKLGSYFRGMENVQNVEIHPVLTDAIYHGKSVEFKTLELRVLKCLLEDARLPIVDISKMANLSARRVRSVLRNLEEGRGVNFTIRWNTAAAGSVRFFLRITYNPHETQHDEVVNVLREKYPREFWLHWNAILEPLVFASFTVDSIEEARRLSVEAQSISLFQSTSTWICYPPRKFTSYPETWLKNLLSGA